MSTNDFWTEDVLDLLLSDGLTAALSVITDDAPFISGPIGLLWDETADSIDALALATTLAELGRTVEALELIESVAQYQWASAAAA